MKKKMMLSVAFVISVLPMFMNQYGGCRGVQEISGLINLLNPVAIISVVLFIAGVWVPFKKTILNFCMGATGVIGMVVAEIYTFLTWHVSTITGEISIQSSLRLAYPEFYIGLCVSIIMVIVYFVVSKKVEE